MFRLKIVAVVAGVAACGTAAVYGGLVPAQVVSGATPGVYAPGGQPMAVHSAPLDDGSGDVPGDRSGDAAEPAGEDATTLHALGALGAVLQGVSDLDASSTAASPDLGRVTGAREALEGLLGSFDQALNQAAPAGAVSGQTAPAQPKTVDALWSGVTPTSVAPPVGGLLAGASLPSVVTQLRSSADRLVDAVRDGDTAQVRALPQSLVADASALVTAAMTRLGVAPLG